MRRSKARSPRFSNSRLNCTCEIPLPSQATAMTFAVSVTPGLWSRRKLSPSHTIGAVALSPRNHIVYLPRYCVGDCAYACVKRRLSVRRPGSAHVLTRRCKAPSPPPTAPSAPRRNCPTAAAQELCCPVTRARVDGYANKRLVQPAKVMCRHYIETIKSKTTVVWEMIRIMGPPRHRGGSHASA